MQGLKIQCPNCKRKDFVTTEKFNPNVTPNGSFVKCTLPYHIEWLTSSVTSVSEMTCPECMAQLAPHGILHVLVPARECGRFFEDEIEELEKYIAFRDAKTVDGGNEIRTPVMSKSVERRLEAQMGKKRGKR